MMNENVETLDKKILEAQESLAELQKRREKIVELPIEKRLATELHSMLCHSNHVDGCSWDYEVIRTCFDANGQEINYIEFRKNDDPNAREEHHVNWDAFRHKEYFEKAQSMLQVTDYDTIMEIIKISKRF